MSFFSLTEVTVSYRHGLPLITLTLPSRNERCQFVVKPMLSTVGSFLQDIQNEDKGIKNAAVFTTGIYVYIFFFQLRLFLFFLCFASLLSKEEIDSLIIFPSPFIPTVHFPPPPIAVTTLLSVPMSSSSSFFLFFAQSFHLPHNTSPPKLSACSLSTSLSLFCLLVQLIKFHIGVKSQVLVFL